MIAYFVHNLNGYSGAAGQALLLAKNINKRVIFFNFTDVNFVDDNFEFRVINMPSGLFAQLLYILYFSIIFRIRIFHFHGLFASGLVAGTILGRQMILKTTLQGDDDFDTIKKKPLWRLRFFFLKRVDFNVVLSNALYRINTKYLPSGKVIKIPNGVVINESDLLLTGKENIFCYVGLVCERKSTLESIRYFVRNYSKIENSKLYIVGPYKETEIGNNVEFHNSYVLKCFDFVRSAGCSDKIIFTGSLLKSDVLNILGKSKALLFFSKNEGMPNVVLEALSVNCVPIISDIGGVGYEMVSTGVNGYVIDCEAETVSVADIDRLINNKGPFNSALENYNIKVVAKSYDALYAA